MPRDLPHDGHDTCVGGQNCTILMSLSARSPESRDYLGERLAASSLPVHWASCPLWEVLSYQVARQIVPAKSADSQVNKL